MTQYEKEKLIKLRKKGYSWLLQNRKSFDRQYLFPLSITNVLFFV
jgi:hypothetical protein